jgi:predicted nucleic acid-binding protein
MIFVDTGIWYAANVEEDPDHDEARRLLLAATSELVTTDYVVDELLTLLIVRKHHDIAVQIGDDLPTILRPGLGHSRRHCSRLEDILNVQRQNVELH